MSMIAPLVKKRTRLRLSPLMAVALAALGLFDLFGAYSLKRALLPIESADKDVRPDWRSPHLAQNEAETPKLASSYIQTLTRPVFSNTRKPLVGPQSPPTAPSELVTPPGLKLSALALFSKTHRAFVLSASTPNGQWLDVGDQLEGWTLTQMLGSSIVLQSGVKRLTLMLYPDPANEPPRDVSPASKALPRP